MTTTPPYNGPLDPVFPCRWFYTRHCPAIYDAVCGPERDCARLADDETPWQVEVAEAETARRIRCGFGTPIAQLPDGDRTVVEEFQRYLKQQKDE